MNCTELETLLYDIKYKCGDILQGVLGDYEIVDVGIESDGAYYILDKDLKIRLSVDYIQKVNKEVSHLYAKKS